MAKQNVALDMPITRASMHTVVVQKDRLKTKLEENRAAHHAIFEEALAGYKKEAIKLLKQHLKRVEEGSVKVVHVVLPVPSDHTDDYDRAIASLEWTVFDEVELSKRDFDQFVLDAWDWKDEFLTSNSLYAASLQRTDAP
jgi:hypothetical protein